MKKMDEKRMPLIPLRERIQKVKNQKPDSPGLFRVTLKDYYTALSMMDGTLYFDDVYEEIISNADNENSLPLSWFIEEMDGDALSKRERMELLYLTLVEPFTEVKEFDFERRADDE